MVKLGTLKQGQLFKRNESDPYYFVRGAYYKYINRYSCRAYRCANHNAFTHGDVALLKTDLVTKYDPEKDTKVFAQ